jgi:zinc protease
LTPRETTRYRLDNGLELVVIEEHALPVAGMSLCYRVGSRDDPPGKSGFAHFFEHMMFQGSTNVAPNEHFNRLERAGANANAFTGPERTVYWEELPVGQLGLALWLEADRMAGLPDALDQRALDNQRSVIKNERRQGIENQPYGRAYEWVLEAVYPEGHPLRHAVIGSMDDLDRASVEDMVDFFRTYYTPRNAILCIAGDVVPDEVRDMVDQEFGALPPGPAPPPPAMPALAVPMGSGARSHFVEDVPLDRVVIAWRGAEDTGTRDQNAALGVACGVLTVGEHARLRRGLVREPELAQDVSITHMTATLSRGAVSAEASARPGVGVEQLEQPLEAIVRGMKDAPPTEVELARLHARARRDTAQSRITMAGQAIASSIYTSLWDDPHHGDRVLADFLAVGPEEAAAAAGELLTPENMAVLTFTRA